MNTDMDQIRPASVEPRVEEACSSSSSLSLCQVAQPDSAALTFEPGNARYLAYRKWCTHIGLPFASFKDWERINRKVPESVITLAPTKAQSVRSESSSYHEGLHDHLSLSFL